MLGDFGKLSNFFGSVCLFIIEGWGYIFIKFFLFCIYRLFLVSKG